MIESFNILHLFVEVVSVVCAVWMITAKSFRQLNDRIAENKERLIRLEERLHAIYSFCPLNHSRTKKQGRYYAAPEQREID